MKSFALVLAGCGFLGPPIGALPGDGPPGGFPDARDATAQDAMRDASITSIDAAADAAMQPDAMAVAPFCDSTDATLVACYPFEGNVQDASGHGHDPTTTNNASFAAGKVGNGLVIGAMTEVDVPDSSGFDVAALTIEAWVKPTLGSFPTGRGGILDCNNQYGMFVASSGVVTCTASASVSSPAALASGAWSHVACTENGATIALYVDGLVVASAASGALPTSATTGITLGGNNPPGGGDPLVGMLDQLRLFKVARTAAQICADAGKSTCP